MNLRVDIQELNIPFGGWAGTLALLTACFASFYALYGVRVSIGGGFVDWGVAFISGYLLALLLSRVYFGVGLLLVIWISELAFIWIHEGAEFPIILIFWGIGFGILAFVGYGLGRLTRWFGQHLEKIGVNQLLYPTKIIFLTIISFSYLGLAILWLLERF